MRFSLDLINFGGADPLHFDLLFSGAIRCTNSY